MTTLSPIRLLLVDDHAIVRSGLAAFFAQQPDIEVAGLAGDGQEAVLLATELDPDVILMDIKMPGMGGIEAIQRILDKVPDTRILVLSSFPEDDLIIQAVQAGAMGYVLKEDSIEALVEALRHIHTGGTPTNTIVAQTLLRRLRRDKAQAAQSAPLHHTLTERELEVVCLLASGHTNGQIADQLSISERTASTHISRAIRKLEVENRTQLVLYALRHGLAPLHPDDGQD